MSGGIDCETACLLAQADHDGELDAAQAAGLAAHLRHCPQCADVAVRLGLLSAQLAADGFRRTAPPALAERLRRRHRPAFPRKTGPWALAAGMALAASVAWISLPRDGGPGSGPGSAVAGQIVAAHIRALQPGHLMDIPSSDQHTVKPWFAGRVDYAPAVPDLAAKGFPLVGGRLDFVEGRAVAVLIYRKDRHVIELYAWPDPAAAPAPRTEGERAGYRFVRWTAAGMSTWAISDVGPPAFGEFVKAWRDSPEARARE